MSNKQFIAPGVKDAVSDELLQTILTYLQKVSGPDSNGNYKALCPHHSENSPSFYLYPGSGYQCFGCGCKGHLIQLAEHLGVPTNLESKARRTARITNLEATALLRQRGLQPQTIKHFGIVFVERSQAWRYPIQVNGQPAAIRWKHSDSSHKPKYWWDSADKRRFFVYGLDNIPPNATEIFLVAGEPDLWLCHQESIPAISFLGGEGTVKSSYFETLRHHLPSVKTVRVVYDHDDAGRKGAAEAVRIGRESGFEINAYDISGHNTTGRKGFDVSDLFQAVSHV